MIESGWIRVSIATESERDAVAAACFRTGASALQDDGRELIAYVRTAADLQVLTRAVRVVDAGARIGSSPVDDVDWAREWKRNLRVQRAGALSVAPPWLAEGLAAEKTILIDPGMAFGTGDHASTRGALRQLGTIVKPGDRVADLGAGSAVLSIGAAKLGARCVTAVEVDIDAIGNAEANVVMNGVEDRVSVIHGDAGTLLSLLAPVDVIAANILSSVIVALLPSMATALAPRGTAVIAGILDSERPALLQTLDLDGWKLVSDDVEAGWWCGAIVRA